MRLSAVWSGPGKPERTTCNMTELSFGWASDNGTFGQVRNPYDRERIPGGSSGGSAAAVAARMAPLAIAADTLGSIRVPPTLCGLAGLRPSFGRYPKTASTKRLRKRTTEVMEAGQVNVTARMAALADTDEQGIPARQHS